MEASSESDCDVEDGLIDVMCPFVDIGLNIGLPAFEPGGNASASHGEVSGIIPVIEVTEEDKESEVEAIVPQNEEERVAQNLLDENKPGYNSISCDDVIEENQYSHGLEQPCVSATGRTWCPPPMQTLDVNYTSRSQDRLSTEKHELDKSKTLCSNCRRSRACCICLYTWAILIVVCSIVAVALVLIKVVLPYEEAQTFRNASCQGYGTNRLGTKSCSCGKSCKSDFPCSLILVTFKDLETQNNFTAAFSDNEMTIGSQVSTIYLKTRFNHLSSAWKVRTKHNNSNKT